jgi:hypothetical protein
MPLPGRE